MCCAYVRKVRCAVVGTAGGSVQGRSGTRDAVAIRRARKTRTDWRGRLCARPALHRTYFSKGLGHFRRIFHREEGVAHQTLLVSENYGIRSASFCFVTIHACDRQTDGQTDWQNCDSSTVRCITYSRTVKISKQKRRNYGVGYDCIMRRQIII